MKNIETLRNLADRDKRIGAYFIDIIPIALITWGVFHFFEGFDNTLNQYLNRGDNTQPRIIFLNERNLLRSINICIWVVY